MEWKSGCALMSHFVAAFPLPCVHTVSIVLRPGLTPYSLKSLGVCPSATDSSPKVILSAALCKMILTRDSGLR